MIIKDKEIVSILRYVCDKFLDDKDINIRNINVVIEDFIKVQVKASYYKVDTTVQIVAKIECTPDTIYLRTKGMVKYGFINLDFNKIMKEHVKKIPFLTATTDGISIVNDYAQAITYGNGVMEIALKQY